MPSATRAVAASSFAIRSAAEFAGGRLGWGIQAVKATVKATVKAAKVGWS